MPVEQAEYKIADVIYLTAASGDELITAIWCLLWCKIAMNNL